MQCHKIEELGSELHGITFGCHVKMGAGTRGLLPPGFREGLLAFQNTFTESGTTTKQMYAKSLFILPWAIMT